MGAMKVQNSLNKTLHLTGIGLAVQAFYINLTLDSALGGEYLELTPAGPPIINPASVWDINGMPVQNGYNRNNLNKGTQTVNTLGVLGGQNNNANGFRGQKGYYLGNPSLKNGYNLGKTYGGGRDYGITGVQGNVYGDVNGRNKGHQVAGFSPSYRKNKNGNKATYYDDGLGHSGAVQYGVRDQRYKDGVLGNVEVYRAGLPQDGRAGGGIIRSVTSPPILIQQTLPVVQRALPIAPPIPHQLKTSPYVVPAPNKLYVDQPGRQNVLITAV